MESTPKCDVCGRETWKEFSGLLMRCSSCGLIRAKINPAEDELRKAYEHDYFFGGEYTDYLQERQALEINFSHRLKDLKKYLNKKSRLIEIGCSYGFFLNMCRPVVAKCIGYDITKEGIEYAKNEFGLEVYLDDFLNYTGEPVDMICLWDVIEHLRNPGEMMAKISSAIVSGGHLVLSTGDAGSWVAKIRKDKWRMDHPPCRPSFRQARCRGHCPLLARQRRAAPGEPGPANPDAR